MASIKLSDDLLLNCRNLSDNITNNSYRNIYEYCSYNKNEFISIMNESIEVIKNIVENNDMLINNDNEVCTSSFIKFIISALTNIYPATIETVEDINSAKQELNDFYNNNISIVNNKKVIDYLITNVNDDFLGPFTALAITPFFINNKSNLDYDVENELIMLIKTCEDLLNNFEGQKKINSIRIGRLNSQFYDKGKSYDYTNKLLPTLIAYTKMNINDNVIPNFVKYWQPFFELSDKIEEIAYNFELYPQIMRSTPFAFTKYLGNIQNDKTIDLRTKILSLGMTYFLSNTFMLFNSKKPAGFYDITNTQNNSKTFNSLKNVCILGMIDLMASGKHEELQTIFNDIERINQTLYFYSAFKTQVDNIEDFKNYLGKLNNDVTHNIVNCCVNINLDCVKFIGTKCLIQSTMIDKAKKIIDTIKNEDLKNKMYEINDDLSKYYAIPISEIIK